MLYISASSTKKDEMRVIMKKLISGNEAVALGAHEAGISYACACPGTPSTEILDSIAAYKEDIVAEWAPNEEAALESAMEASFAGERALVAMKHVGVSIVSHPLFAVVCSGIGGGLVLVSEDNPSMYSSQNKQKNRYCSGLVKMPMLVPSDSQEAKDMVKAAVEISEKFDTLVLLRMTPRVCNNKTLVEGYGKFAVEKKEYVQNLQKFYDVPAVSRRPCGSLEDRLLFLEDFSNNTELNHIKWNDRRIGVISSGVAYKYAKEIFDDKASYLKIGFSYPLPMKKIREFADEVDTLYVIEEIEPFIEEQIKAAGINCIGKGRNFAKVDGA